MKVDPEATKYALTSLRLLRQDAGARYYAASAWPGGGEG